MVCHLAKKPYRLQERLCQKIGESDERIRQALESYFRDTDNTSLEKYLPDDTERAFATDFAEDMGVSLKHQR